MSSTAPNAQPLVKDATLETFQADVLEASLKTPVIVDFWASWCGPCKTLGPILEKAVKARGGKVLMVKVDTDKNQMLAQQLRIQSLPTVMAFVGGQPVDGFMGAVPESEIATFLDRVVAAAEQMGLEGAPAQEELDVKELLAAGNEALGAGDLTRAIQIFAETANRTEPGSDEQVEAMAGVAMAQMAAGEADGARNTLSQVPEGKQDHPALAQVRAQLDLVGNDMGGDLEGPQAAHEENPEDQEAAMAYAEAQISAGQMEGAIDTLLGMIGRDRDWNEGAARAKLLTLFEALGAAHPEVKKARRRLSSLLFS